MRSSRPPLPHFSCSLRLPFYVRSQGRLQSAKQKHDQLAALLEKLNVCREAHPSLAFSVTHGGIGKWWEEGEREGGREEAAVQSCSLLVRLPAGVPPHACSSTA